MARILSDKEQAALVGSGGVRKNARYPWFQWVTSEWWYLVQGEDFHCARESMRSAARQYARRNGLLLDTSLVPDGVLVCFTAPDDDVDLEPRAEAARSDEAVRRWGSDVP